MLFTRKKFLSLLVICLIYLNFFHANFFLFAGQPGETPQILKPDSISTPPQIDGLLEDDAWQTSALNQNFKTYNPTYGENLPQKTVVWLAYDNENFYFAFRCYDTEPAKIKTSITQRDHIFADDWVGLSLDALGNKQSAYDLFVNPNGIQADILNSAVSGEDTSPDFVWESAGQLTPEGYQVEIKVPLRSIRFKSGKEVKMGILFWRRISRLGVSGSWPELKPGHGIFNVHAPLIYRDLQSPLTLEVLPSVTYSRRTNRENPTFWGQPDVNQDFGFGVKYGLTSSITAEFTVNPDFSQVESDAFQVEVNQRYPVFYREKRPFFMEGLDIVNFAIIHHGQMGTPVHTRQIVDPMWGGKLTGTVGQTSFGLLAAGDDWPGYAWEDTLNPHEGQRANFAIARAKRSFGGDNYFGAIYSGREFAGGYNQVVGGDTQYRCFKNHQTSFSLMQSYSREPDAPQVNSGCAINFIHSYNSKRLGVSTAFEHYDRNFRMDSAFLTRTGVNNGWIWVGPRFYPDSKKHAWFKRFSPQFIFTYLHDLGTGLDDIFVSVPLEFSFSRQGFFMIEFIHDQEGWEGTTFQKKQLNLMGEVQLTKWLGLEAFLIGGDQIYYAGEPAYLGFSYSGQIEVNLQPSSRFNQKFEFFHQDFYRHSDDEKIYEVNILNSRTTFQFNKYFFIRAILQYNSYRRKMLSDFLASFTFIPGTVLHLGYGTIHERKSWQDNKWVDTTGKLYEMKRGLFFKASYLWRY